MKAYAIIYHILLSFLLIVFLLSCTSQQTTATHKEDAYSDDYVTLDTAITKTASYFSQNLTSKSNIALIGFDTENKTLSDYIFEEFWINFEDNSSLVLVDRKNLELISKEMDYQLSGQVSDDSAKSIGRQFGAQTLLYGKLTRLGNEYRLSVYATDVERATSSLRAANIKPDNRLASLLETQSAESPGINMANILYAGFGNPFRFTVQTDKTDGIYHDGDYMTMQIYSEQDTYFKVTHIDVNGKAQVIYPTSPHDNNFIKAGQTRYIPDNTRYKMTKPYGEEIILVAAYSVPFSVSRLNNSVPLSNNVIVRGLVVESAETQTNVQPVATAKFTYSIRP
jgi:hypothetical protein